MRQPLFKDLTFDDSELLVREVADISNQVARGRPITDFTINDGHNYYHLVSAVDDYKWYTTRLNDIRAANKLKNHLQLLKAFSVRQEEQLTRTAIAKAMRYGTTIEKALMDSEEHLERRVLEAADYWLVNYGIWPDYHITGICDIFILR